MLIQNFDHRTHNPQPEHNYDKAGYEDAKYLIGFILA